MTLAGFPPTRVFGGTSLVTTEPAAMTEFSPTVTPPTMVTSAAIHTFFSITMGLPIRYARRSDGATAARRNDTDVRSDHDVIANADLGKVIEGGLH